jgi:hypothetical protein
MATVASGLNSGSGFTSSDTITSTTINTHVNGATVTGIVNADVASNALIAVTKLADITNNNLVGRVNNANNADVPIVIGGSGDAGVLFDNDDLLDNSNTAGGSATRGATQQSIKAYVDDRAADPDRTYHSTSLGTSSGTIQQNTTNRPLLINFGLKSNDEIALLALDISQNSDMSSETRVSMFEIKSDGFNPSRATVSGVVPDTWYWRVTYSGTSSASELFHVGFNL